MLISINEKEYCEEVLKKGDLGEGRSLRWVVNRQSSFIKKHSYTNFTLSIINPKP